VDPVDRDVFVSYTSADRVWAEWIGWQLKQAGLSVVLQAWDMLPGGDFVHEMQRATTTAGRTIAVLSPAYLGSQFGEAEWRVAFANDPRGEKRLLIPVRVAEVSPPGLLATRIYIDLVGKDRDQARRALLDGLKDQPAAVPTTEPAFPGANTAAVEVLGPVGQEPRFPTALPPVWNVPYLRNWAFTGRQGLLAGLADNLGGGTTTAITQAIAGLGGVGKTSLAVEYAYREHTRFEVVWWVRAEEPATLLADYAALAGELRLPEVQAGLSDPEVLVAAVRRWFAGHDRWLLVFDNATRPEEVTELLPAGGGGQVLITSRWAAWDEWAAPLELNVLARGESVAFLHSRTGSSDEQSAVELAELLGDLPLALAEAAAYIDQTRVGLGEYVQLVRDRAVELFDLADPTQLAGAQRRVATVWSLSLQKVAQAAPAAEALLLLCAFLAPEEIPRSLPREQHQVLPEQLGELAADPLAYNGALGVLGRYSLAVVTPDTLSLHRLVQAVLRARLEGDEERRWIEAAISLLRAGFPTDPTDVTSWPAFQRLLPHALAATEHAERLGVAGEATGWLLSRASAYLRERGQPRQARPLAERALTVTEAALPSDHTEVGARHDNLGLVLADLGDLEGARREYERALAIHEAADGPDHPNVARVRNNLGNVLQGLGDRAGARRELERALAIDEAAYGPEHPETQRIRDNLEAL
jgi:tetratricopeptide (TPR) repeat protein